MRYAINSTNPEYGSRSAYMKDRLYVANVGNLPEDWTLEKLMNKHTSKPYNPNIAYVFYLAGFIESWGRGVEKICNALKADNLPITDISAYHTAVSQKLRSIHGIQFCDHGSTLLSFGFHSYNV